MATKAEWQAHLDLVKKYEEDLSEWVESMSEGEGDGDGSTGPGSNPPTPPPPPPGGNEG